MLGTSFERLVEKRPISVMVRGLLERVLGAEHLDAWYEHTAQKQDTRALVFSTVYDRLSHVVLRLQPSVHAAYRKREDPVGTSRVAVSTKLHGVETHTAAELVRDSATGLTPLIVPLGGTCTPWLPGMRVKIVDGHCIEATAHRRKAWRTLPGGALPGKALVVYEPVCGLGTDVFPCEDGPAQERSLLGGVLDTIHPGDLWMQDRNCWTCAWLWGIAQRDAFCMTRQHAGRRDEIVTPCRAAGRADTGRVAEQRIGVRDAQGTPHTLRRIQGT